jgi:DNA repair protein RadC
MKEANISQVSNSEDKTTLDIHNTQKSFEKIKRSIVRKKAKLGKQPHLIDQKALLADKELLKLLLYKASKLSTFEEDAEKLLSTNLSLRSLLYEPATDVLLNSGASTSAVDFLVTLSEVIKSANKKAIIGPVIKYWEEVVIWLSKEIGAAKREYTCTIFTNASNHIIDYECSWSGTVSSSPCFPRELIEKMLKNGASGLIVAHNHPDGSAKPSIQDLEVAKKLSKSLECIDAKFLDFIILSSVGFYSFNQHSKTKL